MMGTGESEALCMPQRKLSLFKGSEQLSVHTQCRRKRDTDSIRQRVSSAVLGMHRQSSATCGLVHAEACVCGLCCHRSSMPQHEIHPAAGLPPPAPRKRGIGG